MLDLNKKKVFLFFSISIFEFFILVDHLHCMLKQKKVLVKFGVYFCCCCGSPRLAYGCARSCGQNERHDQTIETQHLGEDENQNHADVQAWLLGSSAHTRVSHDAHCKASG